MTTDLDVPDHLNAMDLISVNARKLQLSHVIDRGAADIVYAAPSFYYESSKSPLLPSCARGHRFRRRRPTLASRRSKQRRNR